MKYGEILYKRSWIFGKVIGAYKFRAESVPFIHKKNGSYFKCWYKTPKTINEIRQFYGNEKYVRGKRNPRNSTQTYPTQCRIWVL